jgi:formiminotetrahydrofolate cyclodeaminase
MNVRINLSSIKDEDYVKTMALEASSLHDQAVAIEKRVLDYLNENLQ